MAHADRSRRSIRMTDAPRKVIAHVTCGAVTLKLTLTSKLKKKPFSEAVLVPFLKAYYLVNFRVRRIVVF